MPLPIQALPKGIVGLLDLTSSGQGPTVLSEQIVGTMDVLPLFALNKRERVQFQANTAPPVGGSFTTLWNPSALTPSNEGWLVLAFMIHCLTAIGTQYWIAPGIFHPSPPAAQVFLKLGPTATNPNPATASRITAQADQLPVWIPPGSQIAMLAENSVAPVATDFFATLDIVRFRL